MRESIQVWPAEARSPMNAGTDLKTGKGLVKMMNGHFFSGLKETLSSLRRVRGT